MKNFADQLNKPAKYNTLIGDGSPQTDERISKFFIKALLVWNQEENIRQMP
jgi:hypothetical protein